MSNQEEDELDSNSDGTGFRSEIEFDDCVKNATGGCRPIEAKKAMIKIGKRISKCLKCSVSFQNFEIQNILAVYDVGFSVSLTRFVQTYTGHAYYEPDRFPAVRVPVRISNKTANPSQAEPMDNEKAPKSPQNDAGDIDTKLRKIMMGDVYSASRRVSEKVGGYMITDQMARRPQKIKPEKNEVVTVNIFSTGKMTFTGAKSIRSLNYALEHIKPILKHPFIQLVPLRDYAYEQDVNDKAKAALHARIEQLREKEAANEYDGGSL